MKSAWSILVVASACVAFVGCSKPPPPAPAITEPAPAAAAPAEPAPTAETSTPPASSTVNLETVFFDFDSYALTSAAQDTLRRAASSLKGGGDVKVQIEGHCDERGSNEYNLALGERRARAAQEFLIGEGVPAASLSTISYGEERPLEQGTGESVWSRNRRAEFKRM